MPAADPSALGAAFARGVAAARDPENREAVRGGPAVTNLRCWWLGLRCPTCRHTFRPGDPVVVSADGREARHASPDLPCAAGAGPEPLDPAVADAFFRGLTKAWPPGAGLPVVVVTSDHPLAAPPAYGCDRRKCFVCGHTFRPADKVIVCPCGRGAGTCLFAFHCDPEHNRNCWQDWTAAGRERFCPATGGGPPVTDRFDRHRLVPGWDQDRLRAATAVVCGVGALGNEVARLLALCGVGRLVLCDPDRVAASNLSRCALFRDRDVGRLKVEAAAAALADLYPGVVVDARPLTLTRGVGLAELRDADVVLGCLDSRSARLELAGRCNLVRAGWIDGATSPWGGEVRPYLDPDGACYGCGLTAGDRGTADVPWSCLDAAPATPEGAAAPATAVVGGWQAMLAVRRLFGLAVPPDVLVVDGVRGTTHPVRVSRAADCPLHQPVGDAVRVGVTNRGTVGELLAALPAGAVPLTWELVQRSAECPSCGLGVAGWGVPAVTPCPACGAAVRPDTALDLDGAPAELVLADVGVAPREVLAARTADGLRWVELG